MGESVEEFMVTPSPPEGKRIRRCVQTKLSWGRPNENAGSPAADVREEIRKGEDTGKRNTKVKTPKKSPSTRAGRTRLSKSPGNGSCKRSKKNDAAGKSDIVKDLDIVYQNVERPACNLQLEAKLAHEENMLLSAGKQMHPFFTCRKETKRLTESLDIQKLDKGGKWSIYASDDANTYPPFHIVDTQVEDISLDWSNWSFAEQAFGLSRCPMEEDCRRLVEPLKVDPVFLKARHTSLSNPTDINSTTATSTLSNGQFQTQHQSPYSEAHLNNLSLSPRCGRLVGSLDNCSQNGLDEERVLSYYRRPNDWSEHSLWTAKYQPENASEVCGNSHSVSQLSEWLKSWHDKGRKSDKKCKVEEQCVVENNEDRLYNAESDMEDQEDDPCLESVLLVTGPVGSGKSAAIHACAKEEGFEVIEVDASDLRNGTNIKNKYGEAMESHGFNRWSSYNNNNSRRKQNLNVLADAPCTMGNKKSENFGLTTMDVQENDPSQCSWTGETRMANKSLVLFEDVDSVFEDDHGLSSFICTILQLAETSKRPIILTSNSKNRALTRLLDQLVLDFELPSNEELFRHVHTICANERAQISSCLLQQFISSCLGDLRKVIMLLQFWCQGKNHRIGSDILIYSPLHFDIDATHMVIPTAIPWEFKCELSEKILDEISRTLSSIEDNSVPVESDPLEKISSPNVGRVPKGITKSKKNKLKRKMSDPDSPNPANGTDLDDFSDASESLAGADLPRSNKKRPHIILSSQSNDNLSADELPPADIMSSDVNEYPFVDTPTTMLELCSPLNSPAKFQRDDGCQYFLNSVDTASALHICDTFKLQDVSCVPDSCFLSGSEANKREDMSVVVSSKNTSGTLGDLVQSIHASQEQNNNLNRSITNRSLCPISNLYQLDEGLGDSDNGIQELSCSGYQFMDECSQATFSIQSVPKRCDQNSPGTVSVQETWHKLHNQREELKKYVGESQRESLILNITSGLTDLIADSDIMFSGCYPVIIDVLDPSLTPATEPDDFSWYDEQYEMGSTYSQHGLCHFLKHCDNACQDVGSIQTEPLMQEMLISSTNAMALGKLLALESTNRHDTSYGGLHMKETIHDISTRKTQSSLLDVLLPIVPARLSMVLRGSAFHDYLSFSSHISKLESVRISEFSKEKGRRRSRSSQHYLSSSLTLPSKDLELLNRASCFKEALP